MTVNEIWHREALDVLKLLADGSVDLVYCDPPFGTGSAKQSHGMSYGDSFENHQQFLQRHLEEFNRVLKPTGTMYLHLDWHSMSYAWAECNLAFGWENFLNEVIWGYNYGGRGKDRWPRKHDNILVYAKEAGKHVFNWDAIPRVPYRAPDMQRVGRTPEEAEERIARGQVPTDVWDIGIIGTNSKERTGYPTQKPLKLLENVVLASSPPGGLVLDTFAGSGTTGIASHKHGRSFVLADTNPRAIGVMRERFEGLPVEWRM